ncbi:MAG: hypothetical protein HC887_12400 [Desulfobacteraceae bacterium]|nr:hypothetical protein [Desulfobacteraceae bacterium]
MTIHFAYPNVMPPNFIGCGRFAVLKQGNALPPDYCKAVFNTPNKKIVNRAISLLAPDAFRSDRVICEIRDEPDQNYRGDSMDLAYLLSFIRCSRKLRFENDSQAGDLWCTGMIGMEGAIPILEGVDQHGFDLKLKHFLSEETEDQIFILPIINFRELTAERYEEIKKQKVRVLSLSQFRALSDRNIFETKTLLTILPHELSELTDVLFEKPADYQKICNQKTVCFHCSFADRHRRSMELFQDVCS